MFRSIYKNFGKSLIKNTVNGLKLKPSYHQISIVRRFSSNPDEIEKNFQKAIAHFTKIMPEVDNETRLKAIALCKQGSIGPLSTISDMPSILNSKEKTEYQAWNALGDLSIDDAKQQYIQLVNDLLKDDPNKDKEPELIFERRNQVYWIRLNRPKQYNAITYEMYEGLIDALKRSADDPSIKFTIITGNGPYFSSGNDLNNFPRGIQQFDGDIPKAMDSAQEICQRFVASFIDYPKMLIAAINGPAFGIMFTTLGLYDCVIATDKSSFTCPFSSLGQSPEGCSTHLFPKIFGPSKASELLYFNYKMPVDEAHRLGFVSRIIESDKLESYLEEWLYGEKGLVNTCYPNSMFNAKAIVRNEEHRLMLHEINKIECQVLRQSWSSQECAEALEKFYSRK